MSEHTCDGTWRWYCEPCSGLPQDPDPWNETQDESPFRLTPAVWRSRRDEVMQIIADADATLSYKGCQQTAESILTALGFERGRADQTEDDDDEA